MLGALARFETNASLNVLGPFVVFLNYGLQFFQYRLEWIYFWMAQFILDLLDPVFMATNFFHFGARYHRWMFAIVLCSLSLTLPFIFASLSNVIASYKFSCMIIWYAVSRSVAIPLWGMYVGHGGWDLTYNTLRIRTHNLLVIAFGPTGITMTITNCFMNSIRWVAERVYLIVLRFLLCIYASMLCIYRSIRDNAP